MTGVHAFSWPAAGSLKAACVAALTGAAVAALACRPMLAQDTAPAVTCATCHRDVVTAYAQAPMRNAMQSAGSDPLLQSHARLSLERNGYTYTVFTQNGKSTYTVSDSAGSLTVGILWTLGMNSQTWVLEKDGRYYESLVSYIGRIQGLATTPGDEHILPGSLQEAVGRELTEGEVSGCARCHATGFVSGKSPTEQKLIPGLNCERCHTGASQHMADARRGDPYSTIPEALEAMNAGQASNFCGRCHGTFDDVMSKGAIGLLTVRFQPYRLQNSKCFSSRDKRISCLACHDPHQPVDRDQSFYDSKCLACHKASRASARSSALQPKTCPVATEKCVSCHMPKVELPAAHAVFTDHQIRIVRAGDPFPG